MKNNACFTEQYLKIKTKYSYKMSAVRGLPCSLLNRSPKVIEPKSLIMSTIGGNFFILLLLYCSVKHACFKFQVSLLYLNFAAASKSKSYHLIKFILLFLY